MAEILINGRGRQYPHRVTFDGRSYSEAIVETISAERSRAGKLWGFGTGGITPTASFSLGSVLWFRNDSPDQDWHIHKIIFGWNGGSTNFNRTLFSLIHYKTGAPSANHTAIDAAIENISRTGSAAAVTKPNFLGYKWDGVGTGMTVGSGGFTQIPNRIAQGDTEKSINGEIIVGPGDSMEFRVTPEETGEFHVSVVFYETGNGKARGEEDG